MVNKKCRLHNLLIDESPPALRMEINHIAGLIAPDFDSPTFEQIFDDIVKLFSGDFPGYQASNTAYHDLDHSLMVTLAMSRLLHGLSLGGERFSGREVLQGLCAALFHDTGLIQTEDDTEGTGAKYTLGHEQRSILLMGAYLSGRGFSAEEINDCSQMIKCTILTLPPGEIPFRSERCSLLGKALGTVDLLAQMADRKYLEKLPLLFKEFGEGGIPGYKSELEMLRKTEQFHRSVVQTRLINELDNIAPVMKRHFYQRWGLGRDLYAEAIARNINHLNYIDELCRGDEDCFEQKLRRGGILRDLMDKEENQPARSGSPPAKES